jgi:hypothetical protein
MFHFFKGLLGSVNGVGGVKILHRELLELRCGVSKLLQTFLVNVKNTTRSSEVVRAGLRILDAEERAHAACSFPPGSLRHLYTKTDNRAERRTAKASTLKVETE